MSNADVTRIIEAEKAKVGGRPTILFCSDFSAVPGFPGCCTSCHDDWNDGYDSPVETEYKGVLLSTCCKVSAWLDKNI